MTSCFVGAYLSASGVLTSNGSALANREIYLYLDGEKVASANTDVNGAYSTLIRVPYKYVSYVAVNALYTPQQRQRCLFGVGESVVKVQVLFYRTLLQVSIPTVAYPGLSFNINGNVTSQEGLPLANRQIRITLDNQIIGEATTGSNGSFAVSKVIASQEKLGVHSLTVIVSSSGLYNDASMQRNITIKKMDSTLQISAPSTVILPSSLFINGIVKSTSGPLSDTTVTIEFANTTIKVKTLGDGCFNATLDIPFSTVFETRITVTFCQ